MFRDFVQGTSLWCKYVLTLAIIRLPKHASPEKLTESRLKKRRSGAAIFSSMARQCIGNISDNFHWGPNTSYRTLIQWNKIRNGRFWLFQAGFIHLDDFYKQLSIKTMMEEADPVFMEKTELLPRHAIIYS